MNTDVSNSDNFDFMRVDFRFIEVEYELFVLKRHIHLVEEELERIRAQVSGQFDTSKTQCEEIQYERDRLQQLTDLDLPLFFRGPIVVSLWAIFESATREIADEIGRKEECGIALKDIKGGALDCRIKYFDKILKFSISRDGVELERLDSLYDIRNCIAHNNGRLNAMPEHKRTRIKHIATCNTEGLEISSDYLLLKSAFVYQSFYLVDRVLKDLIV